MFDVYNIDGYKGTYSIAENAYRAAELCDGWVVDVDDDEDYDDIWDDDQLSDDFDAY